ncbi:rRNA-processing protein utp21 [Tilletia horrida]|uniref:rRNA-processing protein utp21 n=1 Tax=Tilletia horrida TaxID=155126 RepID=A0AAN6JJM5_9BASI|nr:rRNA-processing protein utp21 [Tilletia horrida]
MHAHRSSSARGSNGAGGDGGGGRDDARAVKRQKKVTVDAAAVGSSSNSSSSSSSRLFAPFRALGFITTSVAPALSVRRGGKDASQPDLTIVTCLGNAWAMWGLNHGMPLLFVGPALSDPIRALAITQSPDSVLAVSGSKVWQYVRGKLAGVYDTADEFSQEWDDDDSDDPDDDSSDDDEDATGVVQKGARSGTSANGTKLGPALLAFADFVLALSERGDKLFVWSLLNHTLLRVIQFPTAESASSASAPFTAINLEHPATYLNKVVITSAEGGAQLWNVRTGSLIHNFDASRLQAFASLHTASASEDDRKLVAVAQTPAVDVLAFGYSSGHILLHDIRKDEPVLRARVQDGIPSPHVQENLRHKKVSDDYALAHAIQGATRPISFRTDGVAQSMAVGTRAGTVAVFDLESDGLDALDEILVGTANAAHADPDALVAAQASSSAAAHVRGARLAQTIRNAHDDAVPLAYAEFIPGQPLLLTAAGDNKLRQWFFEPASADGKAPKVSGTAGGTSTTQGGGVPRLLKSREGHHAPPALIRHYGEDGKNILSAGSDRSLRCISVVRDSRSYELSQGSLQKKSTALSLPLSTLKLSPAGDLSFSTTRSRDWDDVLSAHSGSATAHTWTVRDKRMGQGYLTTSPQAATSDAAAALSGKGKKKPSGPAGANRRLAFGTDAQLPAATAVHVSACGNFGLVGGQDGLVQMWNMQSYLWRKTFDTAAPIGGKTAGVGAAAAAVKRSPVVGVTSDALNRAVIVATANGKISFFDFASTKLLHRASLPAGANALQLRLHTDSSLLAVLCGDAHVRLYDISTYRLVRDFVCGPSDASLLAMAGSEGKRPRLSDLAFSPDGRWLVVTSSDARIRTYDLPSGQLIDLFQTPSPCTSLSFSPSSDFLATVHEDSVGVYLWLNRGLFGHVTLRSIDEDALLRSEQQQQRTAGASEAKAAAMALPTVQGNLEDEELAGLADEAGLDAGEPELQRTFYTSPVQLFETERRSGEVGSVNTRRPLITLSTMPRSRWMTLLNLDVIKARNKPKEKPKAPERAPFFLPQIAGTQFGFDTSEMEAKAKAEALALAEAEGFGGGGGGGGGGARRLLSDAGGLNMESEMGRRLRVAVESGKHAPLFQYLHALSTPALDLEIRSLSRLTDLTNFLRAMTLRLRAHLDYEAVQAMLAVFVRVHGDVLIAHGVRPKALEGGEDGEMQVEEPTEGDEEAEGRALAEAVRQVLVELHAESSRVMELLDYCLGSLALIRDIPLV